MLTDVGEYLVGAYLQLKLDCDVVDYNVRPPGGGLDGLEEMDVIGFNFKQRRTYLLGHFSNVACAAINTYGLTSEPTCWMEIGYASGFLSLCMRKRILVREVECRSTGFPHCRAIAKPVDDWDNPQEDLKYFDSRLLEKPSFVQLPAHRTDPTPSVSKAFRLLNQRISSFVSLPIAKLDVQSLQKKLDDIGEERTSSP